MSSNMHRYGAPPCDKQSLTTISDVFYNFEPSWGLQVVIYVYEYVYIYIYIYIHTYIYIYICEFQQPFHPGPLLMCAWNRRDLSVLEENKSPCDAPGGALAF